MSSSLTCIAPLRSTLLSAPWSSRVHLVLGLGRLKRQILNSILGGTSFNQRRQLDVGCHNVPVIYTWLRQLPFAAGRSAAAGLDFTLFAAIIRCYVA